MDGRRDLGLEVGLVGGRMGVEDDEVHGHAAALPVPVRGENLAQRRDSLGGADRRQDDRPIAGDSMGPEPRLGAPVLLEFGLGCPGGRVAEIEVAGQLLKHRGVGGREAEFAELDQARGGGQVEGPLGRVRIVIAAGHLERPLAAGGDQGREGHRRRLPGIDPHSGSEREDRIQHGAGRATEFTIRLQRHRIANRTAPAQEPGPVGLAGHPADPLLPGIDDVDTPERRIRRGARAPDGRDRGTPLMPLGFDEQIAERRVSPVGVGRSQHDLAVARQLDLARVVSIVGDGHPPHLGRLLGHDGDLGPGFDVAIVPVKGDPVDREGRQIPVGRGTDRLMSGRPHPSVVQILEVAELPGGIGRPIVAPTGNRQILVPGVSAAAVGHHQRERWPAQECDPRLRCIGRADFPDDGALGDRIGADLVGRVGPGIAKHEPAGDSFVEQQLDRSDQGVGVEPLLPDPVGQHVGERHQTHPDVVGHEIVDDGMVGSRGASGVIDRVEEPELAQRREPLDRRQIPEGVLRVHQGREHGCVRGHHDVAPEPPFEGEVGNAERPVLIGEMPVAPVVRALAHAPGHAAFGPVRDLAPNRAAIGLIQQGEGERLHHQGGHQVLEHAPAPRHHGRGARRVGQGPAEPEPMFEREVVLGDGHEAREPGLGREEVIGGRIERVAGLGVADREEFLLRIEQEAELHLHGIGVGPLGDRGEPGRQSGRVGGSIVPLGRPNAPVDPLDRRRGLCAGQSGRLDQGDDLAECRGEAGENGWFVAPVGGRPDLGSRPPQFSPRGRQGPAGRLEPA